MGELFLANLDQLVDRPAGEPEPGLGLKGPLALTLVRRLGPLLFGQRLPLFAADEAGADQRRARK